MRENPNTCPECSKNIPAEWGKGKILGVGVWSGRPGGSVVSVTCPHCGVKLLCFGTNEEMDAKLYFWEREDSN